MVMGYPAGRVWILPLVSLYVFRLACVRESDLEARLSDSDSGKSFGGGKRGTGEGERLFKRLPFSPVSGVLGSGSRSTGKREEIVEDARGGGITTGEAVTDAGGIRGKLEIGEVEARRDSAAHESIGRPRTGHGAEPATAGHDMDKLLPCREILSQQAVLTTAVRVDDRQT